ncbi:MAG: DUF3857 domain-containing protein [Cyclobacteriaceae bacterium]
MRGLLLTGWIVIIHALHTTGQDVIVQSSDIRYQISSIQNSVYNYKAISLINNAAGKEKVLPIIPKDSYHRLKSVHGRVLDKNGKVIERFSKEDFVDYSANSSVTFKDDQRLLVYWIESQAYPYTLELEYIITQKESLYHTSWIPQASEGIEVIESTFTIENPLGLKVNYHVNESDDINTIKELSSTKELLSWRVDSLEAYTENNLAKDWWHYSPGVIFTLDEFEISGTAGSFSTWEEFGSWYYNLNSEASDLRADMIPLEEMMRGANSRLDTIRLANQWVKRQTRYSSIQLGIGGWKSLPASEVLNQGYGDCKALSTFTMNVLKLLGIQSYYALVKAGKGRDIVSEFPASQFNHVILAVPDRKDTLWLECTSQIAAFGQLGSFTSGKNCLIVNESSSHLQIARNWKNAPPKYLRELSFKINGEGVTNIRLTETFTGEMTETDGLDNTLWQNQEVQERWLQNRYRNYGSYDSHNLTRMDPYTIRANYEFAHHKAVRRANNLFILNRPVVVVIELFEQDRFGTSSAFNISERLTLRDKIVIEGTELVVKGRGIEQIDSRFGTIVSNVSQRKNGVEMEITVTFYPGEYTKSDYLGFQSFLKKGRHALESKLLLSKKT